MKRSNDQSIGEVIKDFLQAYHLEDKLNETKLIHSWENVVGKMVAKHSTRLFVKNHVLFVQLDSPALRNELSFSREKLIQSLNREVGSEVITDIVFQ